MKNKSLYILLAFVGIFSYSCTDLDTAPEGSTITSKQKNEIYTLDPSKADAAVNAVFAQFSQYEPNSDAIGARHNDFGYPSIMFLTDAGGYDMVSSDVGYNWMGNALDYSDRDYTSREAQIVWNDLYTMILTTNNVIGAIPLETTNTQNQFNLAQGLATRAFCYFNLAQLYQFNYVGHQDNPCVPLITNENANDAAKNGAPRATVQEVYDQIMTDLDNAISLLTSAENDGIARADKRYISLAVAYGIRARVNLVMQNWADAATDASSAISHSDAVPASRSDVSVPYFWSASEGDWMWGIIISETDDVVQSGIVNWISHMGSLNYGYANYSKGFQISKSLYESMPTSDVRKGWWLDANSTSVNLSIAQQAFINEKGYGAYTQVKFAPYQNVVGTAINANDIPLMRIEEMYLIKAEGLAMSGGDGLSVLNNFVKTYRDPSYNFTQTSASTVQTEVYRQRRIELWGEGLSWYDIMRLNIPVDRRGCGFPNATMVFNIPAGSDILLWRITEAEIQANPAISDNDNNPVAPLPTAVADN